MTNVGPMDVEARLAEIRRQKLHLEQLVELEHEERRLMALQGGTMMTQAHLPTPSHISQSTEMPGPTPRRATSAVDLTTPPPRLELKQEPKQEKEDSPEAAPAPAPAPASAEMDQDSNRRDGTPPLDSDDVPLQRRANLKRGRDNTASRMPADSPPPNDTSQSQADTTSNSTHRPAKKRKQAEPSCTSVVDDEEYRTIIKAPDGGEGLFEITCKFCDANSAAYSGLKLLYKGINSWRGHINSCHRNELPEGQKLHSKYVIDHCLTKRPLTPAEEHAVLNHEHDQFVVIKKVGPGAEPGSSIRKPRKKRGSLATEPAAAEPAPIEPAPTEPSQEDEAEGDLILGAIGQPNESGVAKSDAPPSPKKLRLRSRDVTKDELASGSPISAPTSYHDFFPKETPSSPGHRTFGMSTRKGGRRTRNTPDYVMGKLE